MAASDQDLDSCTNPSSSRFKDTPEKETGYRLASSLIPDDDSSSSSLSIEGDLRERFYSSSSSLSIDGDLRKRSRCDSDCSYSTPSQASHQKRLRLQHVLLWWGSRFFIVVFIFASMLTVVIFVGSRLENKKVRYSRSTLEHYTTPNVCATSSNVLTAMNNFATYSNATAVHADNNRVVHCGECGACSNVNDIRIMVETKNNITATTYKCAMKGLFRGRGAAEKCMIATVGFTSECTECWVTDVRCAIKKCLFSCLKYRLLHQSNNNDDGTLNPCIACDEHMCGPDFIRCAGANRRRLGIVSDIQRNDTVEQCTVVDFDWEKSYYA